MDLQTIKRVLTAQKCKNTVMLMCKSALPKLI